MGFGLFQYDKPFFRFMEKLWELMILNFIAVLFCLPLLTAGASMTALYYVTLKMAENRESHIYRSFLKAFRENLLQTLPLTAALTAAVVLTTSGIQYLYHEGAAGRIALLPSQTAVVLVSAVLAAVLLLLFILLLYVFALQARFVNPIWRTCLNAIRMGIRHLPATAFMLLVTFGFYYIMVFTASWLLFWLLSGPIYIHSLVLSRIFRKYL